MAWVRSRRFMALETSEWIALGAAAFVFLTAIWAMGVEMTLLPALGVLLTAVVFGHFCMTAARLVAFPDLIALAACLQWVIAPWLAEHYPPTFPMFRMTLGADEYLRYALPATAALWVALHIPLDRSLSENWAMPRVQPLSRRAQFALDAVLVIALFVEINHDAFPSSLAFLTYLIGSFRFFAALGWLVTRTRGWWIRTVVILLHLIAQQSAGGVFYLVVHWAGYFVIVYAFMKRWRWQLAVALGIGLLVIGALQEVKPTLRKSIKEGEVSGQLESFEKLVSLMWARVGSAEPFAIEEPGDFLVRFNQGWIISRVMTRVPRAVPYAWGETIGEGLVFSIVPRFLFPNKPLGISQELFAKYTGVELNTTTTMGLGIIGEFYANFGLWGGVLATGVYGLLMGWFFAFFAARAARNPLWWAAAAIVVLPGVEPGFNFEDIANHVVKAAVVFSILFKTLPALQQLLALAPASGTRESAPLGSVGPELRYP